MSLSNLTTSSLLVRPENSLYFVLVAVYDQLLIMVYTQVLPRMQFKQQGIDCL